MSDKAQGTAVPKRRGRQFSADERKQILDRAKELDNVVAVAKEWGVAPSTVYSWRERYEEKGIEGLVDKSSRPHHQPKKTTQWIIDKVLRLKKERPEIGIEATSQHLARFEAVTLSGNTVGKIFKKHGLPDGDAAAAEAAYKVKGDDGRLVEQAVEKELDEWERFCRPNPNVS